MLSDEDIMARCITGGDRQAFGVLVQRHQGSVRQFLRRLCRDTALADDLAQEAFLKAFAGAAGYSGQGRVISWLYRIAHREFLQHARKSKRQTEVHSEVQADPQDGFGGTGISPDPIRALDLQSALDHLAEHERVAVVLCTGQGLSHAEAADVLHLPLGTVKSHVTRGLQKLRRIMADPDVRTAS